MTATLQDTRHVVESLLNSEEPSIRWKTRVHVLGEDPASTTTEKLQDEIRQSRLVSCLLAQRDELGKLSQTAVYGKWQGAHHIATQPGDLNKIYSRTAP